MLSVGEQEELGEVRRLELAHDFAAYRVAISIDRFGGLQADEADAAGHVRLPAAEQH